MLKFCRNERVINFKFVSVRYSLAERLSLSLIL